MGKEQDPAVEEQTGAEDIITLEAAGIELRFERKAAFQNYDTFINTSGTGKLSKAANNYCVASICKQDLVTFRQMKEQNPGLALQLSGELANIVAPDVEVTVKKH